MAAYWGQRVEKLERGTTKWQKETSGVMSMFIILVVMIVSEMYKYVKTSQIDTLIMFSLLCGNYTWIKLSQKKERLSSGEIH